MMNERVSRNESEVVTRFVVVQVGVKSGGSFPSREPECFAM